MQNEISCLIFDFDGVIANTDLARYKLLKELLKEYDLELSKSFTQKDIIGLSTKGFLKKHSTILNQLEIDKIICKRHNLFFSNLSKYCIPFKNMKESIVYFNSNFSLAIATTNDTDNVKTQLEHLGVKKYFKWILGRDITENKDIEKTYELIPSVIKKETSECIVIEDSNFGVNAAVKEGYYCIRFDSNNFFPKGLENDRVRSYKELKAKIDKNTTR